MDQRRIAWSTILAATMVLPLATSVDAARFGGGGAHFGGGGAHFGGGGMHFGGGGMHFGGGGIPHFGGFHFGGGHFGGLHVGHATHFGTSHFALHHVAPAVTAHGAAPLRALGRGEEGPGGRVGEAARGNSGLHEGRIPADARAALAPRRMPLAAANARFAERGAPFHSWHHWRRFAGFYGWAGPLFWPYAYDDIYDDLFWGGPYYYDPFWDYGYGDLYGALFSPFGYQELAGYLPGGGYVPGAKAGGAELQGMCGSDSRSIVDWPIERLQQLLQPTAEQRNLLDALANASMEAARVIKTACTTTAALTPSGRLAAMRTRIDAMIQAVNIIRTPLGRFYDSLTDEQKARFVAADQSASAQPSGGPAGASCSAVNPAVQWPQAEIERAIHPTPDQQEKIDTLRNASVEATDIIAKACPAQLPTTPPARLDAIANRLNALLDAVKLVQGPLNDLYSSLSDEQKAQFNVIGQGRTAPTARR